MQTQDQIAVASLPYITSPGNIEKALNGIKAAQVPDRVSQDFVKTILKIPGGSGDQVTTFLKKINFAASDGTPTDLYTTFRNPTTAGQSVAKAIRHAYAPLYVRNEYMHNLSEDELLGLIVEETGQAHDSNRVKLAFACINALKKYADFSSASETVEVVEDRTDGPDGPTEKFVTFNSLSHHENYRCWPEYRIYNQFEFTGHSRPQPYSMLYSKL